MPEENVPTVAELQAQIAQLTAALGRAQGADDVTPSAIERMLAVLEQQAKTQATHVERTAPRENPNYKAVSIFLQENGEPWAKLLKCDMYLGLMHLNRTPMTKAEVDAWNHVEPIVDARLRKMDGSSVLATVTAKRDAVGRIDQMTVLLPLKKEDNPQLYSPLADIAAQLAAQVTVAA